VAEHFYSDPEAFWSERLSALKRAVEREQAYLNQQIPTGGYV
jgi:hypothetical protein